MLEKQFITKTYYRSLIHENDSRHPIEILGELFAEEEQKEFPMHPKFVLPKVKSIFIIKIMKQPSLNGKTCITN